MENRVQNLIKFEQYGFKPSAVIEALNKWYEHGVGTFFKIKRPDSKEGDRKYYTFYDHDKAIDDAIKYLRGMDIFYTPGMKWDDVKYKLNSRACLAEFGFDNVYDAWPKVNSCFVGPRTERENEIRDYILKRVDINGIKIPESFRDPDASVENLIAYLFALLMQERKNKELAEEIQGRYCEKNARLQNKVEMWERLYNGGGIIMSIFENMNASEIAMCLSAFYYAAKKYTHAQLYDTQVYLPNREKPISIDRSDYDEGIKILREDYGVFWTPDTKPDDLKWKINKRRMKELDERIRKNSYIDTDSVLGRVTFGTGCVVTGNDYLYRRELGLPDNATVADILERIRELKSERDSLYTWKKRHQLIENSWYGYGMLSTPGCAVDNNYAYRRVLGLPNNAPVADILDRIKELKDENSELAQELKTVEQDKQKLKEAVEDISRDRGNIERLRKHWHSKYEKEHEECVRLSKLHAADEEKKNKQDTVIHNLRDSNTTLEYSVAALKKRIRSMEAEAAEKETKTKVITDTLRDNLVDSIEECKRLNAKIKDLERTIRTLDDEEDE